MNQSPCDALVIGSGPNGLAAAITLARAGLAVRLLEANPTVGGGIRSAELTLPGFVHDVCSAIHPLALGSPFFRTLPLQEQNLEWIHPPFPLAHPLDDGSAVTLHKGIRETAESLGADGEAYRRLFAPFARDWEKVAAEFLQPMLHLPRHPLTLANFGLAAIFPATVLARSRFKRAPAQALFAGIAAHSFLPLEAPASAAFALVLGAAGHAVGWPLPRGGSQALADALANQLRLLGGEIETDQRIEKLDDLPPTRVTLFDTTCWQFARIAGPQLPSRYRRHLQRFPHAPGVCKVDYALSEPVPWRAAECRAAGTVHLGGSMEEIAEAEREITRGRHPAQPFVLVAQQSIFDETRAPNGQHTLWTYCHVPNDSDRDMSAAIEAQIERFAPGFRDCILARHISRAVDLAHGNANLVGGDINGGDNHLWQLIARPVLSPTPYRTPLPGVYLCSSSTPPGGGVHGMCGYHAARAALRDRFDVQLPATPA